MASLKVLPVDVLEHICFHLDSTTAVHLAIVADNAALNAILLRHLLLVKLWQSTDHAIVRWLVANRAEGVSFKSWTIAAERGWLDVIAYLHEHHGMDPVAAIEHLVQHGTEDDWSQFDPLNVPKARLLQLNAAAATLDMYRAVYPHFPRSIQQEAIIAAALNGSLGLIRLLPHRQFDRKVVRAATRSGNLELVKYLHDGCFHPSGDRGCSGQAGCAHGGGSRGVANIRHVDPSDPGNLDITVGMYLVQAATVQDMKRGLPATLRRVTPYGRDLRQLGNRCWLTAKHLLHKETGDKQLDALCDVAGCTRIKLIHRLVPDALLHSPGRLPLNSAREAHPTEPRPRELLHACITDDDIAWGIRTAAARNRLPLVEYLCEERPEQDVASALAAAVEKGNLEIVKFLHPRCPTGCSESAVREALDLKHWDVLK
ncbi:hypothetical protein RI367_008343 [Sorochytrium milnesiophthora]